MSSKRSSFLSCPIQSTETWAAWRGGGKRLRDGTQESQEGFKGTQILPTASWTPWRGWPRSHWECPTHRTPRPTATPARCAPYPYNPLPVVGSLCALPMAAVRVTVSRWLVRTCRKLPKSEGQGKTTNLNFSTTFVKTEKSLPAFGLMCCRVKKRLTMNYCHFRRKRQGEGIRKLI